MEQLKSENYAFANHYLEMYSYRAILRVDFMGFQKHWSFYFRIPTGISIYNFTNNIFFKEYSHNMVISTVCKKN